MRSAVLGATLVALISADSVRADEHLEKTDSWVIPCEKVIGAAVRLETGAKDEIEDLAFVARTGRIHAAILASGEVLPYASLQWMQEKASFGVAKAAEASEGKKKADVLGGAASSEEKMWLLSRVEGLKIYGESTGNAKRSSLASVGGVHIDVRSGTVSFVIAPVGGVLGIGADSKIIPWAAVTVQRDVDGQSELFVKLSAERLGAAPVWGEAEKQLHNPEFRDSIYAFYGVSKPGHDRSGGRDFGRLSTLEDLIGCNVNLSGKKLTIKDVLLQPKSGEVSYVELSNDMVLPLTALEWQTAQDRFQVKNDSARASDQNLAEFIRGSALDGITVRATDGDVGSANRYWVEFEKRTISYVSVKIGTTLGLGGEEKVLPWRALTLDRKSAKELVLFLPMKKTAVERAPTLDSSVGEDLYNPAFRARVDAFLTSRVEVGLRTGE